MTPTDAVKARLRPLYLAVILQSFSLWVPVEKLFMTSIGFDAASVGIMAAAYAGVVPLLEVPSGILADRWSRRGVLMVANIALMLSALIGGLSTNVGSYIVAALFLGVFFAMRSGTIESIVYDTVLEETGSSDTFERSIGRVRFVESAALVIGALAGGALAEVSPLRVTYLLTVPFVAGSIFVLLALREPRLHEAEAGEPLRRQVVTTYRAILERGRVRSVVAMMVLTALVLQLMLEFGPLWMVALAAPAIVYGPHWAGLMAALGFGGLIGGRLGFTSPARIGFVGAAMVASSLALTTSHNTVVVVGAQVLLLLLVMAVSIPITRRLHDAVPSGIRAGVSSGVGTLTWITFMPIALVFGAVSNSAGVHAAGWIFVAATAVTAAVMVAFVFRQPTEAAVAAEAQPPVPVFAPERFLPHDDAEWPGHWATPPPAWNELPAVSRGSAEALVAVRDAITSLPPQPREVIELRDVEGRPPAEVSATLDIDTDTERALLHQARGHVRAQLESHFAGGE